MTPARRSARLAAPILLLALAVTTTAAAMNDACTNATDIENDDFSAGVFLSTATADPADPANACVAGKPDHTVWFRWTASETARVIVHTCLTATDTTLAAFTGECGALAATGACSDDSACGAGSILDFGAVKGQEYVFELGSHPGAMADFVAFQLCAFTPDADDKDEDLIPNCADPCTDSDKDGFGDPGFPLNVCPPDNCPEHENPDQTDSDGDGTGDACDQCPDDFDGLDLDGDGTPDCADECTDTDHDGFGNPFFADNTCPVDNCPLDANPDQLDLDGDAIGDVCDQCPGESDDLDTDGDDIPDCRDACTDTDLDQFGDQGFPHNECPADNCAPVHNPDQGDADGDGIGDPCDPDQPRDPCLSVAGAAARAIVSLSSKGCFMGDCIAIEVVNDTDSSVCVDVPRGTVLLPRDPEEQILSTTRDLRIHVPPHRTVRVNGVFTACLQLDQHGPEQGKMYDVTDLLSVVAAVHPVAGQLLALVEVVNARHGWNAGDAQSAIWDVADGTPVGPRALPWITAAGLDPAGLVGGFPDVDSPNARSTDPRSRFLPGVLSAPTPTTTTTTTIPAGGATTTTMPSGGIATTTTPPGRAPICAPTGTPAEVRCWVDHLAALVTDAPTLRKALRRKLGRQLRVARTKLRAADRSRPAVRTQRLRAVGAQLDTFGRTVTGATGAGLLAGDLATALGSATAGARAALVTALAPPAF